MDNRVNGFWDCRCKGVHHQPEEDFCPGCDATPADSPHSKAEEIAALPLTAGIYIARTPEGGVITNVPLRVVHHSPGGFEFGYGGSGPADLALNILEAMFRDHIPFRGRNTRCYKGQCLATAWNLHQDFKWKFIGGIDRETGGVIPFEDVKGWILGKLATSDSHIRVVLTDGQERQHYITDIPPEELGEYAKQATDGNWRWEEEEAEVDETQN